jgi:hypothetical protein
MAEAEAALLTRKFIDSLPHLILSPLKMAFTREDVTQTTRTAGVVPIIASCLAAAAAQRSTAWGKFR